MGLGLDLVSGNLGTSLEILICLLVFLGGIIFYAKDFKLGIMMHLLGYVAVVIVFIEKNLNYKLPITLMFMFLIIFVFTIIFFQKSTQARGVS